MLDLQKYKQARISRDPRFDGVFFVLVKTTGIFCRNICTVRLPYEENVSYAQNAVEAIELGYRPCLRCRPDSAPNSYAWQGTGTTLNRAIRLMTEDCTISLPELYEKLGISDRYLRKLFAQGIQTNPIQFLTIQRVLMAKRLLQETNFSIENVADSAGFSSARQLQHHFRKYLNLSPRQVRNSQAKKLRIESLPDQPGGNNGENDNFDHKSELFLSYRPPYAWEQLRDFFALRQLQLNETIKANSIIKIFRIEDEAILVEMEHIPSNHGFVVRFPTRCSKHTVSIIKKVKHMLDLDAQPDLISAALESAGIPAERQIPGIRIPGVPDLFETGCRAILGQQVSVKAAVNKLNQLLEIFGNNLPKAFPSSTDLSKSDLEQLKVPVARRNSLLALANSLNEKQDLPVTDWISIKGIGPWTVNYVLMRGKSDTDIWLDSDLVIKQRCAKLAENGWRILPEKAAPWRTYLTLSLWAFKDYD